MNETLIPLVLLLTAAVTAQQPHQDHHGQMNARGKQAMGFDQEAVAHHFFLHDNGGTIQVTVKDPRDSANLAAIRDHLPHIATMFAAGDFTTPAFVHAADVPGVDGMTRLRTEIAYAYEDIPNGGRVRITTRNTRALAALHDFLRYQITDHKTGDPLRVTPVP